MAAHPTTFYHGITSWADMVTHISLFLWHTHFLTCLQHTFLTTKQNSHITLHTIKILTAPGRGLEAASSSSSYYKHHSLLLQSLGEYHLPQTLLPHTLPLFHFLLHAACLSHPPPCCSHAPLPLPATASSLRRQGIYLGGGGGTGGRTLGNATLHTHRLFLLHLRRGRRHFLLLRGRHLSILRQEVCVCAVLEHMSWKTSNRWVTSITYHTPFWRQEQTVPWDRRRRNTAYASARTSSSLPYLCRASSHRTCSVFLPVLQNL